MICRVAAYCRVSTDSEDQANSLASQERFFRQYIKRNQKWQLVQVFVDTGITGTSTKKRAAFNQMIDEAIAGNFDLILTKEISRFARNTLDSIYYTRMLKERGIGVLFMNDNINTLDADAELRLTIMSSIAQEESRKTSERVKWGQKRRMEQGIVFGRDLLGYDIRDGQLYINEEGAEAVRLIFHKFVNEGKGTHTIAKELEAEGIKTSTYMRHWSNTAIRRILCNEKMAGDLVQKKTITISYLTHEKKCNQGEEELVIIRNHHEPIVSRELFDNAQKEIARRSQSLGQKAKHSNRYCFSGRIKCTACKSSYVSRTKKRKNGSIYKSWRCYQASVYGRKHTDLNGRETGCNSPSVNEEELRTLMMELIKSLSLDKNKLIQKVLHTVTEAVYTDSGSNTAKYAEEKLKAIIIKKQRLIDIYIAGDITKSEFEKLKVKYEKMLENLEQERESALQGTKDSQLEEMNRFICGLIKGELWDDIFYRHLLNFIEVYENGDLTIHLNMVKDEWKAART